MLTLLLAAAVALPTLAQPKAEPAPKPVAMVGNRLITWSELAPQMAEAVGAQILEEFALGQALRDECLKRSITIGESEIRAERRLLAELLARSVNVSDDEAETLINRVRASRGLGDIRFRALLERNAALRALVRQNAFDTSVTITPDDISTAYDLKYGPRIQVDLILVRTAQEAEAASARLSSGEDFASVARQVSVDPSRDNGGRLDPFSLADTNYPAALRLALNALPMGKVSNPIAVTWTDGTGYAVVRPNAQTPSPFGSPTKESVQSELEREVRAVRERAQMEKVADTILRSLEISPMDKSLNWSWERRQNANTP